MSTSDHLEKLFAPPLEALFTRDIITVARRGFDSGPHGAYSVADAYAPLNFATMRCCDQRVWSFFF